MKKLSFIIASLLMVAFIVSCEKESMNDSQIMPSGEEMSALKAKPVFNQEDQEDSWEGVTPVIIPGENNGGNVTCSEVADIFEVEFDLCGDKIDYYEGDGFAGEFPAGLTVTVNEEAKTLSFDMEDCILIGDEYYKVGAVIVKGGRAANIYYYEGGILSDGNLTAPEGKMISNVTFCFVECEEEEELIIALKFFSRDPDGNTWLGVSCGDFVFSSGWCGEYYPLGINDYIEGNSFCVYSPDYGNTIGEVAIADGNITLTLEENWILASTKLFVGTLEELNSNLIDGCPDISTWMGAYPLANSVTFNIP